jgi:hypothetical protein
MEGRNQFRIKYIYTWKCHNETLSIDISYKQRCHYETLSIDISYKQKCNFSRTEDRKIKQVLSGGLYQWEGEDIKRHCGRVNMVKILCTHVSK